MDKKAKFVTLGSKIYPVKEETLKLSEKALKMTHSKDVDVSKVDSKLKLQVPKEIENLRINVSNLSSLINSLNERLSPIETDYEDSEEKEEKMPDVCCLAKALDEENYKLRILNEKIQKIINNLQI